MIDSITLHIPNFVTYSDEFFTKAQYQELKGEFGVFGRFATRYTDYPQRCKTEGRITPKPRSCMCSSPFCSQTKTPV